MPIQQTDIKLYASTNNLGGPITGTELTGVLHELFDEVDKDESAAGQVRYRCFYVANEHGTLTYRTVEAFMKTVTPSSSTAMSIGVGTAAAGGTEQTIPNETTAPIGVSFETGIGTANSVSLGDIPNQSHKAIWIRNTVNSGAFAEDGDGTTVNINGATSK